MYCEYCKKNIDNINEFLVSHHEHNKESCLKKVLNTPFDSIMNDRPSPKVKAPFKRRNGGFK